MDKRQKALLATLLFAHITGTNFEFALETLEGEESTEGYERYSGALRSVRDLNNLSNYNPKDHRLMQDLLKEAADVQV